MPITSSDIEFRLSGGSSNSNPDASLGGAKSSVEVVDDTLNNLFDTVTGAEAATGDVEYRCIYVHNGNAELTMIGTKFSIQSNSSSPDTTLAIGLGSSAIDGTEQTVANENAAPSDVVFGTDELTIGDLEAGEHKAVWIRRTVSENAAADNSDEATLRVTCETEA